MSNSPQTIRLGTRGSALARWQTDHIAALLRQVHPGIQTEIVTFTTRGDQVVDRPLPEVGGKGLFTAELEAALRNEEIDLAVHSLKDLPTDDPIGLTIGAIPARAATADVLISRQGYMLDTLPQGAVIGTSSLRRASQLLYYRPDLRVLDIRGNIDTRIRKALDPAGPYDAIILAHAGAERLGYTDVISEIISHEIMLPAPGQGALAVQCRAEWEALELLTPLDHLPTRHTVTAERAFLAALGGGCSIPVAACGHIQGSELHLRGRVVSPDGTHRIDLAASAHLLTQDERVAETSGINLARQALQQGASEILALKDTHG